MKNVPRNPLTQSKSLQPILIKTKEKKKASKKYKNFAQSIEFIHSIGNPTSWYCHKRCKAIHSPYMTALPSVYSLVMNKRFGSENFFGLHQKQTPTELTQRRQNQTKNTQQHNTKENY